MTTPKNNILLSVCSVLLTQSTMLQRRIESCGNGRAGGGRRGEGGALLGLAASSAGGPPSLDYVSNMLQKGIELVDNITNSRLDSRFPQQLLADDPEPAIGLKIVNMDVVLLLMQQHHHTEKNKRNASQRGGSTNLFSPSRRPNSSNDESNITDDASTGTIDSISTVYKCRRRRHTGRLLGGKKDGATKKNKSKRRPTSN